jgi:hypothetical protein
VSPLAGLPPSANGEASPTPRMRRWPPARTARSPSWPPISASPLIISAASSAPPRVTRSRATGCGCASAPRSSAWPAASAPSRGWPPISASPIRATSAASSAARRGTRLRRCVARSPERPTPAPLRAPDNRRLARGHGRVAGAPKCSAPASKCARAASATGTVALTRSWREGVDRSSRGRGRGRHRRDRPSRRARLLPALVAVLPLRGARAGRARAKRWPAGFNPTTVDLPPVTRPGPEHNSPQAAISCPETRASREWAPWLYRVSRRPRIHAGSCDRAPARRPGRRSVPRRPPRQRRA